MTDTNKNLIVQLTDSLKNQSTSTGPLSQDVQDLILKGTEFEEVKMPKDEENKTINIEDFASDLSSIYVDPNNFSINMNSVRIDVPDQKVELDNLDKITT